MMSRVPVELQAVFLASNRGQEVNKPPPGRLANRVFTLRNPRKWFWNRRGKKSKKAKAMEEKTSETATSGTSSPMGDIFVPVSVPSSSSRFIGRGKAPPLKRADSATSSVTFQFNTSQVKKAPKPKDPKVRTRRSCDDQLEAFRTVAHIIPLSSFRSSRRKPTSTPCCEFEAIPLGDMKF